MQIGARGVHRLVVGGMRARDLQLGRLNTGIELHEDLALLDPITAIDADFLDNARDGGAVRAEAVPATGVPSSLKKRKEERVGAVSAWHHEMPELRSRPWDGDAYIALHRPPSAKNPEETLRNPKLGFL